MKEQGTIRFADWILAGARWDAGVLPSERTLLRPNNACADALHNAAIVVCDEASDLYWSTPKDNYVNLTTDFPSLVMPFETMWLEYKIPPFKGLGHLDKVGVFFESQKMTEPVTALRGFFPNNDFSQDDLNAVQIPLIRRWNEASFHWVWLIRASVSVLTAGKVVVPYGHAVFCVSPQGEFLTPQIRVHYEVTSGFMASRGIMISQMEQEILDLLRPALLAVSLMNCKNVKMQRQEPPTALSKAFQKRHGRAMVRYHTLEIEAMKKVLENEGGLSQNGLKKALHICRGHFATYTPEHGMLGRKLEAPVTVWKPAHVRGSAAEGIVGKDYRVKAPQTA